ncbi:hypothetical protein GCM10027598_58230 [Amycolatopsis oliviviridis]|uniref:SnoaL-like domain-containing protein n=1 Tax=Amycolatopsis oliviviridis TaxID=1471590 RepID=A0ABQ3LY56_9PSEU|nr:hypothetical protein GCM10017790_58880 [Amycolatopsis oliviviridis]
MAWGTAPSEQYSPTVVAVQARETTNKTLVKRFFHAVNRGDLTAAGRALHVDLVQHKPGLANGREALLRHQAALRAKHPELRYDIKRLFAEGNLVVVHGNLVRERGDAGIAVMNVFRLDDGRIAEQWEVSQEVPAASAIGNDMFSTLSAPQVSRPLPLSTDADSKLAAGGLFAEVINEPDAALRRQGIDRYIGDNTYYQHFPGVPNGSAALVEFMDAVYAAQPDYRADVKFVVAEGDLVLVYAHLKNLFADPEVLSADLFRVRDGRLLEHWVALETLPAG